MNKVIKIDHLSKSFGEVKAVQDVSFSVREGELFAFLGVNGAGKSTTINIMCGQLGKDSGKVEINGFDTDVDMMSIKHGLGVVFQDSVLDKALSVYDNLHSRAALYGINGQEFKSRLSELSKLLDFEDLLKRPVAKLSGGQRRRIDIARALLNEPKVLVLDEPVSGVDAKGSEIFYEAILNLKKNYHMAIAMVSHDLGIVREYADNVVLINKTVLKTGSAQEVFDSQEFKDVFFSVPERWA